MVAWKSVLEGGGELNFPIKMLADSSHSRISEIDILSDRFSSALVIM